jgi:hypothetical protein
VIPARLLGDPAWAECELDVELPLPVLLSDTAEVLEPADPAQKLPPLVPPVTIVGQLSKAGERDVFTIAAPPGSKHEVRVEAWGLGSALDGHLRVFDKDGRSLGEADDGKGTTGRRGGGGRRARGPFSTDPVFDLTMPPGQGEVKVAVKDLMDRGGVGFAYRLVVRPAETSFQLTLSDQSAAVPRGRTALIPVTVVRNGYGGPIALDIRELPTDSGVTAIPGIVPAGQNNGVVGLKSAADSPFQALEAQVIGQGDKGQVITASTSVAFAHQTMSTPGFGMAGTIPSYARPFVSFTAAVTRPGPILLNPQAAKLVVVQGSTVEVPVQVVRTVKSKQTFKLAALSPPVGLSVAGSSIAEAETSVQLKLTAAPDAPVGPVMVGLVAQEPVRGNNARADDDDMPQPQASPPPPVAAAMISVEVVRAAKPK